MPVVLRDFARIIPAQPPQAGASTLWDFIHDGLRRQRSKPRPSRWRTRSKTAEPSCCSTAWTKSPRAPSASSCATPCSSLPSATPPAGSSSPAARFPGCRVETAVQGRQRKREDFLLHPRGVRRGEDRSVHRRVVRRSPAVGRGQAGRRRAAHPRTAKRPAPARPLATGVQSAPPHRHGPGAHPTKAACYDARALLYEDTVVSFSGAGNSSSWPATPRPPACANCWSRRAGRMSISSGLPSGGWPTGSWRGRHEERLADIGIRAPAGAGRIAPLTRSQWAWKVIETIKHRAGLLLERLPQVYLSAPHVSGIPRGACLASQARFAQDAAKLLETGAFWRGSHPPGRGQAGLSERRHRQAAGPRRRTLSAERRPRRSAGSKPGSPGEVLGEMGLPRVRESAPWAATCWNACKDGSQNYWMPARSRPWSAPKPAWRSANSATCVRALV